MDHELHPSRAAGDAARLASTGFAAGWRRFAIAGGDGTANEVVNGLLSLTPGTEEITLAMLPLGTGNDWCRSLGIPRNLKRASRVLASGKAVLCDAGRIILQRDGRPANRYFLNTCGAGFDAYVASRMKGVRSGRWQYFAGLIRGARGFTAPHLRVRAEGCQYDGPALAVLACNGGFLGGGMRVAPRAKYDDGLLEVLIVEAMSAARIVAHVPRLLFGDLGGSRRVRCFRAASLEISGDTEIQGDGEVLGRNPARIEVVPTAFRVMVG